MSTASESTTTTIDPTLMRWQSPRYHGSCTYQASPTVEIYAGMDDDGRWYAVTRASYDYDSYVGALSIHADGRHDTAEAAIVEGMDLVPLIEALHEQAAAYMAEIRGGDDA